jgi:hypothetical protein
MKHANTTNKLTLKVRSIRQMTPHHPKYPLEQPINPCRPPNDLRLTLPSDARWQPLNYLLHKRLQTLQPTNRQPGVRSAGSTDSWCRDDKHWGAGYSDSTRSTHEDRHKADSVSAAAADLRRASARRFRDHIPCGEGYFVQTVQNAGASTTSHSAFELAETLGLEPTVAVPRADGSVAQLARKPIRPSRTPVTY